MRWIIGVALVALPLATMADARDREIECEKIKQDIRMIQSKMRAGYTRAEGEKLRAKLRKLRALRSKVCR